MKKIVTTTITEEIIDVNESTEIVCILDQSGSMCNIIDDMIGGFNTFLDEQKKIKGKCNITIALFDDRYELLYDNVDIKTIKPLSKKEWSPRGSTALYDAIGKTVNDVQARHLKNSLNKPDKVLVCVVTDGQENSSKEFKSFDIKKLMAKKEEEKWSFLYLAANQNAFDVGGRMGFSGGNTMNFNADVAGSSFVNSKLSASATSYRSMSSTDTNYDTLKKNIINNLTNDKDNPNQIIQNNLTGDKDWSNNSFSGDINSSLFSTDTSKTGGTITDNGLSYTFVSPDGNALGNKINLIEPEKEDEK